MEGSALVDGEVLESKKFRIGVLMGGVSVEREVSFNSGRTVCDHIDVDRYDVIPIFQTFSGDLYILPWKFLYRGKISDFLDRLPLEAKKIVWDDLKNLVDFIYIAVHGYYAEDGTLQGMLECLKIPYLASKVFGCACGIDKVFQKKLLRSKNIIVPKDVVLSPRFVKKLEKDKKLLSDVLQKMDEKGVTFPCIVKPAKEGSSLGISVVFSQDDLIDALKNAAYKDVTREQSVLIEEKIEGMEFTSIALTRKSDWWSLPITEVVNEAGTHFYDYDQKYMPGRSTKITPARCSEEEMQKIQSVCKDVADILNFATFFRVDGFLTKDGKVVITDPNSSSGMGPASFFFHQAAEIGLSHTHLINYLVDSELDQYGLSVMEGDAFTEGDRGRWDLLQVDLNNFFDQFDAESGFVKVEKRGGEMSVGRKKKIAVLLGGDSNEREISLESGRNVCYKLSPSKYDVIPIFIDEEMRLHKLSPRLLIQNSTREIREQIKPELQLKWADLKSICDFAFIALHGGKGENGSVQGALEMLGIPYNGPGVLASSLCMDKFKTNEFLKEQGFSVPASCLVHKSDLESEKKSFFETFLNNETDTLRSLIVKPHDDGCSMYVQKVDVKTEQDFFDSLQRFFTETGGDKDIALVEECVLGMELTCGVIGNEDIFVFPPSQAVSRGDILSIEEKFLPGAGENRTPAPLGEKQIALVQDVVKRAYIAVGCKGYSRIDCFYQDEKTSPTGEERVVILEVNTLPGLTPATCLFHQASEVGIRPMELIDKIVELGFENHTFTEISDSNKEMSKKIILKKTGEVEKGQ